MKTLRFRKAVAADAPRITEIVNQAYRGSGNSWTSEAHLVGGLRTTEAGILDHMGEPGAWFELTILDEKIVGSVYLKAESKSVLYLGMFAVDPTLQGQALGRQFLEHVEEHAIQQGFKRIRMTVIHLRTELIAYYERRGYNRSDSPESPFPFNDPNIGVPLVSGLRLVELVKELT